MGWIICMAPERLEPGEDQLNWSNSEGFTNGDDFDTFTDKERETMQLPFGGVWVEAPWKAEG
ncbi:hypothetical protein [uncultured Rhodoblastus sp.]|jgi:hypothetical protein|uniref:hypothetical protein n=1 Tax=uncultured Rhodoblastus sp. TaxID=543037 RepID=UPI0025FB029D|nr:hypothetical protein [uncultured Rhodoblastus sp.]